MANFSVPFWVDWCQLNEVWHQTTHEKLFLGQAWSRVRHEKHFSSAISLRTRDEKHFSSIVPLQTRHEKHFSSTIPLRARDEKRFWSIVPLQTRHEKSFSTFTWLQTSFQEDSGGMVPCQTSALKCYPTKPMCKNKNLQKDFLTNTGCSKNSGFKFNRLWCSRGCPFEFTSTRLSKCWTFSHFRSSSQNPLSLFFDKYRGVLLAQLKNIRYICCGKDVCLRQIRPIRSH